MFTNGHTARDALSFIFSHQANFRAGEVIYIDAREASAETTWAEHPQQRLLNQSPGGRSIGIMIERSEMTDDEKRRVLKAATSKFLVVANGGVEVILDDKTPRELFVRFELPTILRNELIQEVNGIPREKLFALHAADPHPDKITAIPVIMDSLRERAIVREPKIEDQASKPNELVILEREIEMIVGDRLKTLGQKIKAAEGELNRAVLSWNAYVAERDALGWEKMLPTVRIRLVTEKWAKKKELRIKRKTLDTLLKTQSKEERALISGRYSAHIRAALEQNGIRLDEIYGSSSKQVIAKAIEKVIVNHKAEGERLEPPRKEALRPKMKQKV